MMSPLFVPAYQSSGNLVVRIVVALLPLCRIWCKVIARMSYTSNSDQPEGTGCLQLRTLPNIARVTSVGKCGWLHEFRQG